MKQKQSELEPDYSIRYGKDWGRLSLETKKLTNSRCCVCGKRQRPGNLETHHVRYGTWDPQKKKWEALGDSAIPLVDLFPVCKAPCHGLLHTPATYIWDGVLGSRNKPEVIEKLRASVRVKEPAQKTQKKNASSDLPIAFFDLLVRAIVW
jgi:hypothetical protein